MISESRTPAAVPAETVQRVHAFRASQPEHDRTEHEHYCTETARQLAADASPAGALRVVWLRSLPPLSDDVRLALEAILSVPCFGVY